MGLSGRQELLLNQGGAPKHVDLLHMMSYDQNGGHHCKKSRDSTPALLPFLGTYRRSRVFPATLEFGHKMVDQGAKILPAGRLTAGLPFYGRHSTSG